MASPSSFGSFRRASSQKRVSLHPSGLEGGSKRSIFFGSSISGERSPGFARFGDDAELELPADLEPPAGPNAADLVEEMDIDALSTSLTDVVGGLALDKPTTRAIFSALASEVAELRTRAAEAAARVDEAQAGFDTEERERALRVAAHWRRETRRTIDGMRQASSKDAKQCAARLPAARACALAARLHISRAFMRRDRLVKKREAELRAEYAERIAAAKGAAATAEAQYAALRLSVREAGLAASGLGAGEDANTTVLRSTTVVVVRTVVVVYSVHRGESLWPIRVRQPAVGVRADGDAAIDERAPHRAQVVRPRVHAALRVGHRRGRRPARGGRPVARV